MGQPGRALLRHPSQTCAAAHGLPLSGCTRGNRSRVPGPLESARGASLLLDVQGLSASEGKSRRLNCQAFGITSPPRYPMLEDAARQLERKLAARPDLKHLRVKQRGKTITLYSET